MKLRGFGHYFFLKENIKIQHRTSELNINIDPWFEIIVTVKVSNTVNGTNVCVSISLNFRF